MNKVFKAKQSRKEFLRAKQTFRNFFFAEVLFLYVEIKFTNYFTLSVVKPFWEPGSNDTFTLISFLLAELIKIIFKICNKTQLELDI